MRVQFIQKLPELSYKKFSTRKSEITASAFKSFRFKYVTNAAFPYLYVLFS